MFNIVFVLLQILISVSLVTIHVLQLFINSSLVLKCSINVFVLLQILMNASLVTIHVTRIVLTTKEVISAYVMRVLYS